MRALGSPVADPELLTLDGVVGGEHQSTIEYSCIHDLSATVKREIRLGHRRDRDSPGRRAIARPKLVVPRVEIDNEERQRAANVNRRKDREKIRAHVGNLGGGRSIRLPELQVEESRV